LSEQIGLTKLYKRVDEGAWADLSREIVEGGRTYAPFG
jgi:hypothetical protein